MQLPWATKQLSLCNPVYPFGGFHKWWYPNSWIVYISWTILLKWMIWWYPNFGKPPWIMCLWFEWATKRWKTAWLGDFFAIPRRRFLWRIIPRSHGSWPSTKVNHQQKWTMLIHFPVRKLLVYQKVFMGKSTTNLGQSTRCVVLLLRWIVFWYQWDYLLTS